MRADRATRAFVQAVHEQLVQPAHEDRMRRLLTAEDVGHAYRPAFVEVPGVDAARPRWAPEPARSLPPWQAALAACGVEIVAVWQEPRSTVLIQLCPWCGRRVVTRVDDADVRATRAEPYVVAIDALDRARDEHVAARGCATAAHDPGDEDPGEGAARRKWRPAP